MINCCLKDQSCSKANFYELFSLGNLSLANLIKKGETEEIWSEKFSLLHCNKCGFIQTQKKIPDDKLADENFYVSEHTSTIIENYKLLIEKLISLANLSGNSRILEIGCGDGTLLRMFYEKGYYNLTGVEPNDYGKKYSFKIINDFFNQSIIEKLKEQHEIPDLIILNSVIETIPNIGEFFSELSGFMKTDSYAFIEIPYFFSYVKNKRIDAFSHLTSSWLTANSLYEICEKFGFETVAFEIDDQYRGGSIKIMIKKTISTTKNHSIEFIQLVKQEKEEFSAEFFRKFNSELSLLRNNITASIQSLIAEGYDVLCYGGGLKASTMINWLLLDTDMVKFAVDIDKHKHGKYIPGSRIRVKSLQNIESSKKIAIIIFALNYLDEVLDYLNNNLPNGSKALIPLPEPRIVSFN